MRPKRGDIMSHKTDDGIYLYIVTWTAGKYVTLDIIRHPFMALRSCHKDLEMDDYTLSTLTKHTVRYYQGGNQ